ncbi:MAG TPA: carboxypeptidase regulatory-like domain-containing protein [Candidatus Angelobacter sp.]|nr:carboxypeptidase regulatory-like domain-containing protein [Candidatus Angelobacter sp.]
MIAWLVAGCAGAACAQGSNASAFDPQNRAETTAQTGAAPVQVGYQKQIEIPAAGASAAYSLDSTVVGASAANGVVTIQGHSPGAANVVVVTPAGTRTIAVVVPQPPPSYPPGFEPPSRDGAYGERGAYEFRYNSDPAQLTNSIEFTRTQGASFNRLQITNATLLTNDSTQSRVGFPLASYEISRPRYDVTFIDRQVNDAPLTLDGYLVRGLHVSEGPWQFHGGFTSVAVFQGLFLSTGPEYVAGASRTFSLQGLGSLEGGFYYFRNPSNQIASGPNGGMGNLTYRWKYKDVAKFLAETGVSHWGLAFASRGSYEDKKSRVTGNFRVEPHRFASLAINNQHGTFADLNASHEFSSRWFGTFNLDQANFNLPLLRQNTFIAGSTVNYKLTRHFTAMSGWTYSRFQSLTPVSPLLSTINIPVGLDFASRHFGTGFGYERTSNNDGSGGNDYSVNVRGSAGRFLMSAFYRHDVQVPTVAAIFAQVPGLEDLLVRAGIVVTTPEELAQLLTNTALLATLGFSTPLTVNLAPARNDLNATVSWLGRSTSHPQVNLSYFDSRTELVQGEFRFTSTTVSYSQRVRGPDDLVASFSLVRTASGPAAPDTRPVFSVSLRHRFASAPGFLLPGRHGTIEGHVFRDDMALGLYEPGEPGIGGVEIRLDGDRVTRTDPDGRYSFHHVPFGAHTVEARFETGEPFFHTTDSPAAAQMNSTIDFGISFAKGQLFGFLMNDAGAGIGGVTIELKGPGVERSAQSMMDGKFAFPALEPGTYSLSTQAATYPPGYSLQNLQSQQVIVEVGKPEKAEIVVRAIRAITGKVTAYDKSELKPVPLAGVIVGIRELLLETHTGSNGAYVFRNLPAGTYTVVITYAGREVTRRVTIPPGPASLRDIDLDVGAK